MKQIHRNYNTVLVVIILLFSLSAIQSNCYAQSDLWQVGVARADITPTDTLWLAGYGSRTHVVEGTLHKLWIKALALQDANGNRAVLVTSDLLGFPKIISDNIFQQCLQRYQLNRSQIILSSSHTHTGPVLRGSLYHVYPITEDHIRQIEKYSSHLEDEIVSLIGEALEKMIPAQLFADNGVVRFQVNRRNNNAGTLSAQADLNGPNDYAVPVLQVRQSNGDLLAVAFGYACHPTVLSSYEWSGDYPGFAQLAIEEKYPGCMALFFQGCGADQNPLPRREVALAQQYGYELAAAVERVMSESTKAIPSDLKTGFSEIELSLTSHPNPEMLQKLANESTIAYQQRWAEQTLNKLKKGESLPTFYPYPIQVWKIGNQSIFTLGGEVVVDYAIELKRIFGQDVFVMGYCNDVMSYIPSARVLREGGYEGATAQIVYGLPSTWTADIEARIIYQMVQLAKDVGVKMPEKELF